MPIVRKEYWFKMWILIIYWSVVQGGFALKLVPHRRLHLFLKSCALVVEFVLRYTMLVTFTQLAAQIIYVCLPCNI